MAACVVKLTSASLKRASYLSGALLRQQCRAFGKGTKRTFRENTLKPAKDTTSIKKLGNLNRFLPSSDVPRTVAPILSRLFSTGGSDDRGDGKRRIRLMDFPEIIWPHPIKSFRNVLFGWLIKGYYDRTFSKTNFLEGAQQAVHHVSQMISTGNFDELEGLVDRQALQEIERSYNQLDIKQRQFLSVDPKDFFFKFLYEIGMIFDDQTNERFVEITVVFQGYHGYNEAKSLDPVKYYQEIQTNQDYLYVCNYRFIREFTKGKEDDWTINKLNHFNPKELVRDTPPFSR